MFIMTSVILGGMIFLGRGVVRAFRSGDAQTGAMLLLAGAGIAGCFIWMAGIDLSVSYGWIIVLASLVPALVTALTLISIASDHD
jgi:hypothetical protein